MPVCEEVWTLLMDSKSDNKSVIIDEYGTRALDFVG